ncbi:hypothetical protein RYX36_032902, partial [Vicia faba]
NKLQDFSVQIAKWTEEGKYVQVGLQFPVGRISRFLKKGRYAQCVTSGLVYLAAFIEYFTA